MFALSDDDLGRRILGCGDGPASFNAEGTDEGYRIVSCDPIYQFGEQEIRRRIHEVYPQIVSSLEQEAENYIWDSMGSVPQLADLRMKAMSRFLSDFDRGRQQGRYVTASLPSLPFADGEFDLALCSHFLFLYSSHVSGDMHLAAMREMCRVASEVRVFPLVSLDGEPSHHLDLVTNTLSADGLEVSTERVDYRFQKGAETMLVVRQQQTKSSALNPERHHA